MFCYVFPFLLLLYLLCFIVLYFHFYNPIVCLRKLEDFDNAYTAFERASVISLNSRNNNNNSSRSHHPQPSFSAKQGSSGNGNANAGGGTSEGGAAVTTPRNPLIHLNFALFCYETGRLAMANEQYNRFVSSAQDLMGLPTEVSLSQLRDLQWIYSVGQWHWHWHWYWPCHCHCHSDTDTFWKEKRKNNLKTKRKQKKSVAKPSKNQRKNCTTIAQSVEYKREENPSKILNNDALGNLLFLFYCDFNIRFYFYCYCYSCRYKLKTYTVGNFFCNKQTFFISSLVPYSIASRL